jgi:lincosamide nucleotidyltransferase A/C/D/E
MIAPDVTAVLGLFERAGIPVWIGGGWGVDALVGRQTRDHADLDLMFDQNLEAAVIELLRPLAYSETLDWRPGRFVMSDGTRQLDLHPIELLPDGSAVQDTHDGQRFDYPPDGFGAGTIDAHPVPCISAALQWTFHQGYEPAAKDLHDLALLEELLAR